MNKSYKLHEDGRYVTFQGRSYKLYHGPTLKGERSVIERNSPLFPRQLLQIAHPPQRLYVIGKLPTDAKVLSVIGARKATPYGRACTEHFASIAAEQGIVIASGGAYGCDSWAHRAALAAGGITIVFLGGGCDQIYPSLHYQLFQDVIDAGGAVVSENPWEYPALPYTFRERNRLIAGYASALLIIEAGLPSGTFSTADDALSAGREVLVVPGAITSKTSAGSNQLLYQGATPIVDKQSFQDVLFSHYHILKQEEHSLQQKKEEVKDYLLEALLAEPLRIDEIKTKLKVPNTNKNQQAWPLTHLIELESRGIIERYPDGRYGPAKLEI